MWRSLVTPEFPKTSAIGMVSGPHIWDFINILSVCGLFYFKNLEKYDFSTMLRILFKNSNYFAENTLVGSSFNIFSVISIA